jgi:chromate reductase, NAD(P)H dehydrogenase (quinone)
MITVFSGTNRNNSATSNVAKQVFDFFLDNTDEEVKLFSLEDLPDDILHVDMYGSENQSSGLAKIQDEYLIKANKLYFVIPEYNGSFPGVLKLFLDACSIRAYKDSFHGGKKAALMGVSSGRAGNLRGLEHFTGVLNYLHITVMPPHQPISNIEKIVNSEGFVQDADNLKAMENHVKKFIQF